MRVLLTGLLCLAVAACDTPNFRTAQFQFGDAKTLAATGNLRFVTERQRKLPYDTATVICSEPSPDYATASGSDINGAIKSTLTQSPISEANGQIKTTELITPLEGRSKGVLALRDGLYAACQAYANGIIGKDAYSIILSQYGMLLVALLEDSPAVSVTAAAADPKAAAAKAAAPVITFAKAKSASAFAALLVACINGFDPTRRDYAKSEAPYDENPVLSRNLCRSVMTRAGSGRAG